MCDILKREKKEFLYEDKQCFIVKTKNMKGHKKRVMIVSKEHSKTLDRTIEKRLLGFFVVWCKSYFDEPTFALVEPTYATHPEHWHRIACDWNGTKKEIKQLHYTPHIAYSTKEGEK